MKALTLIVALTTILACNNKGLLEVHKTDECQLYYEFIHDQLIKKDGYYEFKEKPIYLRSTPEQRATRLKYFNETCLVNLPRKKIHKILGEPNKVDTNEYGQQWRYMYCFNEQCNFKLEVFFKKDVVTNAFPNPDGISSD